MSSLRSDGTAAAKKVNAADDRQMRENLMYGYDPVDNLYYEEDEPPKASSLYSDEVLDEDFLSRLDSGPKDPNKMED